MNKYPFTSTGVFHLQQALYELDDHLLMKEAAKIEENFINWLMYHFILSEDQIYFLASIGSVTLNFMASQTSFAVAYRRPIILKKPSETGIRSSKIVRPESSLTASVDARGEVSAGGEFHITISY